MVPLAESSAVATSSAGRYLRISTSAIVPIDPPVHASAGRIGWWCRLTSADPERPARGCCRWRRSIPLPGVDGGAARIPGGNGRTGDAGFGRCWPASTRGGRRRPPGRADAGMPVRLDLIDVERRHGAIHAAVDAERQTFRDALTVELGMPVVRRLQRRQGRGGGVRDAGGRARKVDG